MNLESNPPPQNRLRVALVYPPFRHKVFNENLAVVDQEFGRFQYISFGYVARYIREAGGEPRLFDAMASNWSYEETVSRIREFQPALLAFAAHSAQTIPDMITWAKRLKADLGLPVLVGGYEASRYHEELLIHSCFDYLCAGDAKPFIAPFLDAFARNGDFADVPNLIYRTQNGLKKNSSAPPLRYEEFGIPDRSIFDHSLYYSHVSQRKNFTVGVSSIGCPYRCSFCCMAGTSYDAKSAELVFAEIEDCYYNHGIREIDWFDPLMFFDKKRILKLCTMLRESGMDLYWSARTRADTLSMKGNAEEPDEAFIRELGRSGCRRLFIGIESGDPTVLGNVKKNLRVAGLHKIFACARANGIRILGFFMIGNPDETHETVDKTIALANSLPIDYAQFSITLMKPDTELTSKHMVNAMGFDYWREFIKGTVPEQILPTPWTKLSRSELERLAHWAYFRFYFRPHYVARALLKIESASELKRYLKVVYRMFGRKILRLS